MKILGIYGIDNTWSIGILFCIVHLPIIVRGKVSEPYYFITIRCVGVVRFHVEDPKTSRDEGITL